MEKVKPTLANTFSREASLLAVVRILMATLLIVLLSIMVNPTNAQSAVEPTQILVGAPAQSELGEPVTIQAVLADGQNHPIPNAVIYFTTASEFLGQSSDIVLAQAVTNANGQAVAHFGVNVSGNLTLKAEFRGNKQYAPSNAAAQIAINGVRQVYTEHVGVDIPGFNVPPTNGSMNLALSSTQGISGTVQKLWPAINAWPVGVILLLVWSMYLLALSYVIRIATPSKNKPEELPEYDSRRLP